MTANAPTAETKSPQKRTFAEVAAGRKIATRVPTVEEPPNLGHHPRSVIERIEEIPPAHAQPLANKIVTTVYEKLQEFRTPFKAQTANWTDTGNLVLRVPTPDDANKMVIEFERWSTSLPVKASYHNSTRRSAR